MPIIRLLQLPAPRALLEAAADGFLSPVPGSPAQPFPSPGYLLALRQGGVRDDLLALAAARGVPGWFDPPLAVFHELPRWLGATRRKPLSETERTVLLTSVLRRKGSRVFARARRLGDFVAAVDHHFGELVAEGVTAEGYRAALTAAGVHEEFEGRRDGDLMDCYAAYLEALAGEGRRDGRDTLADIAQAVRDDPGATATALGGRREIRIFGLTDLRGGWRPLLAALAGTSALDRILIYSMERLDLAGLPHEVELPPPGPAPRPPAGIVAFEAPDPEREVEEVARRVRALAEGGVALDRIGIVCRAARPYVDLAVAALEKFGVPATARQRIAHAEIPIVRAVLTLFAAAAEGWSRHGLTEVAEQPYLGSGLDAELIGFLGYRERLTGLTAWGAAFERLAAQASATEAAAGTDDESDAETGLPSAPRARAAHAAWGEFAARAGGIAAPRPLREWLVWLREFLEQDPWGIAARTHAEPRDPVVARRDITGWRELARIAAEWEEAVNRWKEGDDLLSAEQFDARLREVLSGDAALWTESARGVRVLEALAATHRAFDHLFLVGLSSGHFPRRAPGSPLFSEEERAALVAAGLPLDLSAVWDARERALFTQLVAGGERGLTLSTPALDEGGRETVPSAFLEELQAGLGLTPERIPAHRVLTPGLPLLADWGDAAHTEQVARIEREREIGALGPWNGGIEAPALRAWLAGARGPDYHWSPTQLEAYAKCPWAYFSGRLLGLEQRAEPEDEMDAVTRGTILHRALQLVYEGLAQDRGGPVLLRESELAALTPRVEEALDAAIAALPPEVWLGHPALRVTRRQEMLELLEGYLAWEASEIEVSFDSKSRKHAARRVRTVVQAHEVTFRDITLERGEIRFRFRGRIDRVEVGCDQRLPSDQFVAAVDYKTGKGSTPGGGDARAWGDGVVLQLPLYAHALAQLHPGRAVSRVEYRAIRGREVVHSLNLHQVDKTRREATLDPAAQEKLDAALTRAAQHVAAVRRGEFPAAPPPSCDCPDWCHGFDICRVPGGPRRRTW